MSSASSLAEELTTQSSWLRALATSLVGDSDADDLVQDAIEAALKSPPETDRPIRPWLRRVVSNAARMRFRSRSRRERREEQAEAWQSGGEQADRILERAEMHRDLADAVLALDEPYRQTLLLRYVEGLSAAEISRRTQVPSGTVRSRLKRGLESLRVELDRRHGDRARWQRALIPLTVPGPVVASQVATIATGALIMKVATTAAAAAAIAAIAIFVWPEPDAPRAAGIDHRSNPAVAVPVDAAASPRQVADPGKKVVKRFRTPNDRQRFAATLAVVRARRERYRRRAALAPTNGPAAPVEAAPTGTLDKEYIQDRIRDVAPLIRECYQIGLETGDRSKLNGILKVRFTIDADEEVGGYVSVAALDDEDTPLARAIGECVTETIYSVEFIAPEGGGQISVTYPFGFSNSSDDD